MIEELKEKFKKIEIEANDKAIKSKIAKSKDELTKMKRNIDNIIFCRLQKESKRNNQLLMNNELNYSEEILLMKALTLLNIIPNIIDNETNDTKKEKQENENFLYFILSQNKAKNLNVVNRDTKIEPIQFWKSFLKFKDLKNK